VRHSADDLGGGDKVINEFSTGGESLRETKDGRTKKREDKKTNLKLFR